MDIHTDAKNKGVAMEIAGNDSVEKMTVQQLRLKLRGLGVPAKGCKQDLISTLKSFQDQEVNGEDSVEVEKQILPKDKSICAKNNSKRKSNNTSSVLDQIENISTGSEILEKKRMKTNVNEAKGEDSETTSITMKQELSVKIDEVTGLNSNRTEKKTESKISSTYCGTLDWVDACERHKGSWTVLTHKNPNKEWVPYNPETMRPLPLTADTKHLKLMSWNVNGIRALLKLEGFSALQLAKREDFDVLCLQETKLQEKDVEAIKKTLLEGYENSFWTCSVSKLGYSGTAIISRIKPISVSYGLGISDHDSEGRLITMEFDSFYILCGYVPNSGDGLRRLGYAVGHLS
jgi:exodeoxyribonuclease-3